MSALAVGSTALSAIGCSSDGSTDPAVSGAGTAAPTPPAAGSPATAGTAPAAAGASAPGAGSSAPSTGAAGSGNGAAGTPTAPGTAGAPSGGTGAAGSGASGSGSAGTPAAMGGSGGASSPGTATTLDSLQCVVTPAMTEGPFFVDDVLDRSNLVMGETSDAITKAVPLKLVIGVYNVNGMACMPAAGVQVDIWHADALGVYSDVAPGVVQSVDTRGQKFLRGFQISDAKGIVTFDTVYPGWYMSRTIHIHFKLRMLGSGSSTREFISQMFFDEAVNATVLAKAPYSTHPGMRSVLNDGDHIFNGTQTNSQRPRAGTTPPGMNIMPKLEPMGAGYLATLKIGLAG